MAVLTNDHRYPSILAIRGLSLPVVLVGYRPLAGGLAPVTPDESRRPRPARTPGPIACGASFGGASVRSCGAPRRFTHGWLHPQADRGASGERAAINTHRARHARRTPRRTSRVCRVSGERRRRQSGGNTSMSRFPDLDAPSPSGYAYGGAECAAASPLTRVRIRIHNSEGASGGSRMPLPGERESRPMLTRIR